MDSAESGLHPTRPDTPKSNIEDMVAIAINEKRREVL